MEEEEKMFLDETPYETLWEAYEMGGLETPINDVCFYFSEVGENGFASFLLKAEKKKRLDEILSNVKRLLPTEFGSLLEGAIAKWREQQIDVSSLKKKEMKELESQLDFQAEETAFAEKELDFIRAINILAVKRYKES